MSASPGIFATLVAFVAPLAVAGVAQAGSDYDPCKPVCIQGKCYQTKVDKEKCKKKECKRLCSQWDLQCKRKCEYGPGKCEKIKYSVDKYQCVTKCPKWDTNCKRGCHFDPCHKKHDDDCHDTDVRPDSVCNILSGAAAASACSPLSVERACFSSLEGDDDLYTVATCTGDLVTQCTSEVMNGGALFCDGYYVGAPICANDLDVDLDDEVAPTPTPDVDPGACLAPELTAELSCSVASGMSCALLCEPSATEIWCIQALGEDADWHSFTSCQTSLLDSCAAGCEGDGAVFCDGWIYGGDPACLSQGPDASRLCLGPGC
ncbi:MAG: hypothetical protein R3B09_15195 [Nannocystaceae bacterium]